jgi:ribosomal protein S18 acetylase RimI-like enzyme
MENSAEENKIAISAAREADFKDYREFLFKCWSDTYVSVEQGVTHEDVAEMFKDRLSNEKKDIFINTINNPENVFKIARINDKVVGIIYISKVENVLELLYVKKDMLGKGIGTNLWKSVEDSFDKSKTLTLDVVTYNNRAIKFYEKIGFVNNGRISSNEFPMPLSGVVIKNFVMEKLVVVFN